MKNKIVLGGEEVDLLLPHRREMEIGLRHSLKSIRWLKVRNIYFLSNRLEKTPIKVELGQKYTKMTNLNE